MKPQPGQILHQAKEANWGCVRVEATGHDWAVCRTELGSPILVRPGDQFAEAHEWTSEGCPFTEAEVQW